MSLFKPASNQAAYLKAAFMGLAGSGKTYTASLVAIGMVEHMRTLGLAQAAKPVYFVDSENGSSWMVKLFEEHGVKLEVASTSAFTDLASAMALANEHASVLIIDSITAFWVEFCDTYKRVKKRQRGLEFQDWAWLKSEWRTKFTSRFLNDNVHTIMCGRMGFEYDHYTDDSGKKQIEKTGVKLKAEGELGFEPSLLVQMEREQDLDTNKVVHVAHVMKDRRADKKSLDGKTFKNPTFANFMPHIEYLNLGGQQGGYDEDRTSAGSIEPDTYDRRRTDREIVLDLIQDLLTKHFGQSQEDKIKRITLLDAAFGTSSKTSIEKRISLEELQSGYDRIHLQLEGKPGRFGTLGAPLDDAIPEFQVNGVAGQKEAAGILQEGE